MISNNMGCALKYSMNINPLTENRLEFLSLKEAAQAPLSLFMTKCHIVGNHMLWLYYGTVCWEHGTYNICQVNIFSEHI